MKKVLLLIGITIFVIGGFSYIQSVMFKPVKGCVQVDSFVSQAKSHSHYTKYLCPNNVTKYIVN